MHSRRGFTLVELAIVVAIVGILAVAAGSSLRAARRNASNQAATFELGERLRGLKLRALAEKRTYLAVLVNPAGGVATGCSFIDTTKCLRFVLLYDPAPAWTLAGFDPDTPATNAAVEDVVSLPAGVALDLASAGQTSPAPFDAVKQLDDAVKGTCDGRTCVAMRFRSDGEVSPEYAGASTPVLPGLAFGLKTDAEAQRRAVLVSFPTGIVKTFPY